MKETIKVREITGYDENGNEIVEEVTRTLLANALLPRLYRFHFNRDLMSDMAALHAAYSKKMAALAKDASQEEIAAAQFSAIDLTVFENVSWLMMRVAGEDVKDSPDEWLATVSGVFSIYQVLPIVLRLWDIGTATTSKPKKK